MMFKTFRHLQRTVVGLAAVVLFHILVIENSTAEKWEIISQLPTHREKFSTAVVNDKIYLIGGTPFGVNLKANTRLNLEIEGKLTTP